MGFSEYVYDIKFLEICPNCYCVEGFTAKICNPPIYSCPECGIDFGEGGIKNYFLGYEKYQPILDNIYKGLGIPKEVYENPHN